MRRKRCVTLSPFLVRFLLLRKRQAHPTESRPVHTWRIVFDRLIHYRKLCGGLFGHKRMGETNAPTA